MIGNANQLSALAFDHREGTVNLGFLFRMLGDISFNFLPRNSRRVERVAGQERITADERLWFLQQVIAAAVDHQKAADLLVHHLVAAEQTLVQLQPFGVALPPVNAFQKLRGLHQFVNHLALIVREAVYAERHGNKLELVYLRGNIFIHVLFQKTFIGGLGGRGGPASCLCR